VEVENGGVAILVGTSGWHYKHWVGPFYPERTPPAQFLPFYTERLRTVEINSSFYRLPEQSTLVNWRETAPAGFLFAVKGSRFITHMKKLREPEQAFDKLFERVVCLKEKLGPVLFQLPPRWGPDLERLNGFLRFLPRRMRFAFEFRDPSWFLPEVESILRDHNAAFCIYDFDRRLSPKVVTADFVYLRLHGPEGRYQGQYRQHELAEWANEFRSWDLAGKDVYCYFDNDQAGYAAQDAIVLDRLCRPHE
jgi:uncharacterized protein YecE (DUF72 family)